MIAKLYAVNWVMFGKAKTIEAESPQEAFDTLMRMQEEELILRSPDNKVKAHVLWKNDETGMNERDYQDNAAKSFVKSRNFSNNTMVDEVGRKLNGHVEIEAEKQEIAKSGFYDVGWIAWGEISQVEADCEIDAAKQVEGMSLIELVERSDDPILEAEMPGQTPGWWSEAKSQTFAQ